MSTCRLCGHEIDILVALGALQANPGEHSKQVINAAIAEITRLRTEAASKRKPARNLK